MNPFKHRYYGTKTNLVYIGLVYVTMITGTSSESTEVRVVVLELRYIELDDLYHLFIIYIIKPLTDDDRMYS